MNIYRFGLYFIIIVRSFQRDENFQMKAVYDAREKISTVIRNGESLISYLKRRILQYAINQLVNKEDAMNVLL